VLGAPELDAVDTQGALRSPSPWDSSRERTRTAERCAFGVTPKANSDAEPRLTGPDWYPAHAHLCFSHGAQDRALSLCP